MTRGALGAIAELLGAIGVIATLVYLAAQISAEFDADVSAQLEATTVRRLGEAIPVFDSTSHTLDSGG